ncbi:MAG: class I SAM-dependent methyltransferase, partial [Alphaproteobacteria bacterium]|nr:class I SAM-dependent methyltransferase [Alphaproteobacteria bacterium]
YFSQRKFASQKERSQVLEQLEDQEIDPNGLESEGTLIAEFYLSRPEAEARDLPLHQLLGV